MAKKSKIKMRVNKSDDCVCDICSAKKVSVLDMYDLNINGHIITICDLCNDKLFSKTLKATCYTNNRLKDKHDLKVIQKRNVNLRLYS